MENSKVEINLSLRSFCIEGSEEFIDRKQKELLAFFADSQTGASVSPEKNDATTSFTTNDEHGGQNGPLDKFFKSGLLGLDSHKNLKINCNSMPGSTKSEKARNIAMIYGAYKNNSSFDSQDIVPICRMFSAYDGPNFSSCFKSDKANFIYENSSARKWTLQVTKMGFAKAIQILDSIQKVSN